MDNAYNFGGMLAEKMNQTPNNVLGNAPDMAQEMYNPPGQAYVQSKTMFGGMAEEQLLKLLQNKAELTAEEQEALTYLMNKTGAAIPEFGQMQMETPTQTPAQVGSEMMRDASDAVNRGMGEMKTQVAPKAKSKFMEWWDKL